MKHIIYILLTVTLFLTASCSDDKLNSKDLLVFVRPQGKTSLIRTMSPAGEGASDIMLKLPLSLTREAVVNVEAELKTDMAEVAAYNEKNETSLKPLPESSISIRRAAVLIPAGCLESEDSVQLSVSSVELDEGEYLLPLTIGEVKSSDAGIRASSTASTIYYRITVKIIYLSDVQTPVVGTVIDPKNWEVTCSEGTEQAANLTDGDMASYWRGMARTENRIEIDMKEVHPLQGINLYYEARNPFLFPREFQIYASENGEDWVDIGKVGGYSASTKKELGINFTSGVKMRCFRLHFEPYYAYYAPQINEIEVVK